MIENIIDLPTQLQRSFFVELDVLEEREIVVEDRRQAHSVARHVADLARRERLRETVDVESARRAG